MSRSLAPKPAPARKRAKAATPLSREAIAEVALQQISARGVDGFSLRDVARQLGVYPTALYWYVSSKNDLIAQACVLVLSRITLEVAGETWQSRLSALFKAYRRTMRQHPHLAQLVGAQLLSNAAMDLGMIERILSALQDAGCPSHKLPALYNTVIAAMCGFATLEFAPLPSDASADWAAALQQRVADIPALEYPVLAQHLPALANRAFILRWQSGHEVPLDDSFDEYVEVFISGLSQRIAGLASTTAAN